MVCRQAVRYRRHCVLADPIADISTFIPSFTMRKEDVGVRIQELVGVDEVCSSTGESGTFRPELLQNESIGFSRCCALVFCTV